MITRTIKAPTAAEIGDELFKKLNKFRNAADRQATEMRKLSYAPEERLDILGKAYKAGFRKVLIKQVSTFEQRLYTKKELREFKIWNKLKEYTFYYATLNEFINNLK